MVNKIGVWGRGKTGSHVAKLLKEKPTEVFHSENIPSLSKLQNLDALVIFVPGPVFSPMIDTLIEAKIPIISGVTGLDWPKDLNQKLIDNDLTWLFASNFSLGMNLVHKMIETLSKANKLFENYNFNMHEVHHTKKLDAPSGTALTWKDWLGNDVEITSERTGDVVGLHELTLETPFEKISIKHDAKDRAVFAQGAIFALNKLLNDQSLNKGLVDFQELTMQELL